MRKIARQLNERIEYRPGNTAVIDLPREGAITEITFMVKLWRGSKWRFSTLLSGSVVCIDLPEKRISILPSPNAYEFFVSRNKMNIVWHPGPNFKDPFDHGAIPAFLYSYLILKWTFPDEPIGATGHIEVTLKEILPPERPRKRRRKTNGSNRCNLGTH